MGEAPEMTNDLEPSPWKYSEPLPTALSAESSNNAKGPQLCISSIYGLVIYTTTTYIEVVESTTAFFPLGDEPKPEQTHTSFFLPSAAHSIYLTLDELYIVCLLEDQKTLLVFSLESRKRIATKAFKKRILSVSLSKSNADLAAVLTESSLLILDVNNLVEVEGIDIEARCIDWVPETGKILVLTEECSLSVVEFDEHAEAFSSPEECGRVPYSSDLKARSIYAISDLDFSILAFDESGPELVPLFGTFNDENSIDWMMGLTFMFTNDVEEWVGYSTFYSDWNVLVLGCNAAREIEAYQLYTDQSGTERWKHFGLTGDDIELVENESILRGLALDFAISSASPTSPTLKILTDKSLSARQLIPDPEQADFAGMVAAKRVPKIREVEEVGEEDQEQEEEEEEEEEQSEEGNLDDEDSADSASPESLSPTSKSKGPPAAILEFEDADSESETAENDASTKSASPEPPASPVVAAPVAKPTTAAGPPKSTFGFAAAANATPKTGNSFGATGFGAKASGFSALAAKNSSSTTTTPSSTTSTGMSSFTGFGKGVGGFGAATPNSPSTPTQTAGQAQLTSTPGQPATANPKTTGFPVKAGFGGFGGSTWTTAPSSDPKTSSATGAKPTSGFGYLPTGGFGLKPELKVTAASEPFSGSGASEASKAQAAKDAALMGAPPGASAASGNVSGASEASKAQAAKDALLMGAPPGASTTPSSTSNVSGASEASKLQAAKDAMKFGAPPGASPAPSTTSPSSNISGASEASKLQAAKDAMAFGAPPGASSEESKRQAASDALRFGAPPGVGSEATKPNISGASEASKAQAAKDALAFGAPPGASASVSGASEASKAQAAKDALAFGAPPGASTPSTASEASKRQSALDAALLGPPGASTPNTTPKFASPNMAAPLAQPKSGFGFSGGAAKSGAFGFGASTGFGAKPASATPPSLGFAQGSATPKTGDQKLSQPNFAIPRETLDASRFDDEKDDSDDETDSADEEMAAKEMNKLIAAKDAMKLGAPPGASTPQAATSPITKPVTDASKTLSGAATSTANGFGPLASKPSTTTASTGFSLRSATNQAPIAGINKEMPGDNTKKDGELSLSSLSDAANSLNVSTSSRTSLSTTASTNLSTSSLSNVSKANPAPSTASATPDSSSLFQMLLEKNLKQLSQRQAATQALQDSIQNVKLGSGQVTQSFIHQLGDDLDARLKAVSEWNQSLDLNLKSAKQILENFDGFGYTLNHSSFLFLAEQFDAPDFISEETDRRTQLRSDMAEFDDSLNELAVELMDMERSLKGSTSALDSLSLATPTKLGQGSANKIPAHLRPISSPSALQDKSKVPSLSPNRSKAALASQLHSQSRRVQEVALIVKSLKSQFKALSVASRKSQIASSGDSNASATRTPVKTSEATTQQGDQLTLDTYIPENWNPKAIQRAGQQAKWAQLDQPIWIHGGVTTKSNSKTQNPSGAVSTIAVPSTGSLTSVSSSSHPIGLVKSSSRNRLRATGVNPSTIGSIGSSGSGGGLIRSSLKSSQVLMLRKSRSKSSHGSMRSLDEDLSDLEEDEELSGSDVSTDAYDKRRSAKNQVQQPHFFGIKPKKFAPAVVAAEPVAKTYTTTTVVSPAAPSSGPLGVRIPLSAPSSAQKDIEDVTKPPPAPISPPFAPLKPHPAIPPPSTDTSAKATTSTTAQAAAPSGTAKIGFGGFGAKATAATAKSPAIVKPVLNKRPFKPGIDPVSGAAFNDLAQADLDAEALGPPPAFQEEFYDNYTGVPSKPAATQAPATGLPKPSLGSVATAPAASAAAPKSTTTTTSSIGGQPKFSLGQGNALNLGSAKLGTGAAASTGAAPAKSSGLSFTPGKSTAAAAATVPSTAKTSSATSPAAAGPGAAKSPFSWSKATSAKPVAAQQPADTGADESVYEEEGEENDSEPTTPTAATQASPAAKSTAAANTTAATGASAGAVKSGFSSWVKPGSGAAPPQATPVTATTTPPKASAASIAKPAPFGQTPPTSAQPASTAAAPKGTFGFGAAGAAKPTFGFGGAKLSTAAQATQNTVSPQAASPAGQTPQPAQQAATQAPTATPQGWGNGFAKTNAAVGGQQATQTNAAPAGFGQAAGGFGAQQAGQATTGFPKQQAAAPQSGFPKPGGFGANASQGFQTAAAQTGFPSQTQAAQPAANPGFVKQGAWGTQQQAPAQSGFSNSAPQQTGFQSQQTGSSWTQRSQISQPAAQAPAPAGNFGGFGGQQASGSGWAKTGFSHSFAGGSQAAATSQATGSGFGQRAQLGGGMATQAAKPAGGLPASFGSGFKSTGGGFSGNAGAGGFSGNAGGGWANQQSQASGFANAGANFSQPRR